MHENVPVRFGRGRLDSLATKGLAAYLIVRLSRTRRDIADGLIPSRNVATKTRLIRGHDKITQTA